MEKARIMLNDVGLSWYYWAEVVDTTHYLLNRSPTLDLIHKTPYHTWASKNHSLAHIIVFGCDSFLHIPKERRQKLDSDSKKCILIRCKDGLKGEIIRMRVT